MLKSSIPIVGKAEYLDFFIDNELRRSVVAHEQNTSDVARDDVSTERVARQVYPCSPDMFGAGMMGVIKLMTESRE